MSTMTEVKRFLNDLFHRDDPAAVTSKISHDRDTWASKAQEGEFRFHKNNEWRRTPEFTDQTDSLLRHFGFTPAQYAGRTVVDVGAGSRLRTKFFADSHLVAIEPLADRFVAEIEFCDLTDAAEVHSRPAEELVESLVGRSDLVISINVLDHCYDFADIVGNIRRYLKPDGLAFLTFDMHDEADDMHPLQLTAETCKPIFDSAGLRIERMTTGLGGALGGSQTYGHGPYTLNYWLRPA